jgi:hypothetical protein
MRYLISYPRSGTTWTQLRLALFCHKYLEIPEPLKYINEHVACTHCGYEQRCGPGNSRPSADFEPDDYVGLILRDAKSVTVSCFNFIHDIIAPKRPDFTSQFDISADLNQFARGGMGVERYCRFLNMMNTKLHENPPGQLDIRHYEDFFSPKSTRSLPLILGLDPLTEEQVVYIYESTTMDRFKDRGFCAKEFGDTASFIQEKVSVRQIRRGTTREHEAVLSERTNTYIDNYMRENCLLPQYLERYFGAD